MNHSIMQCMKKMLFLFCLICLALLGVQAQDLITLRDGTDIEGKVLQVSPDEIKYKRADNPDGPLFVLPVEEVLMVRYANGANQVFERPVSPMDLYQGVDYGTSGVVVRGMSYRDYKDLYSPSSYVRLPGDPYIPALSGVCSWLIPGLGQMLCDEVGRGFAYLGGSAGCFLLMVSGAAISVESPGVGLTLVTASTFGMLAIDICSIVDAVRVAKIKNMYEQDLRRQTASVLDVKLQPYVSTVSTGLSRTPVAGLSLAVAF